MASTSRQIIATREMLYSRIGETEKKKLVICITAPYFLAQASVPFTIHDGAAGCAIVFDGIPEDEITIHGADRIQALALAADIDPYLRGLRRKYEFYWETGEPYFDV
jgi:hypothetical protein